MKLIVREYVNSIAVPTKKTYHINLDAYNFAYGIPAHIGVQKGDIIVFKDKFNPVRLPAGTDGQVLVADSTAELGVRWATLP